MVEKLEHGHEPDEISMRLAQGPGGRYLRDWIYGAIDGGVTTFAIVAGVAGAELTNSVLLILGCANLLADGFAMAASNYSATKSERDDYDRVLNIERRHIRLAPEGEREEVRQIFAAKGFAGDDLDRIVDMITRDTELWVRTMAVEEYGHSPTPRSPSRAALSTFAAFLLCGLVPIVSYLASTSLGVCVAATGVTFFAVGAIKSRWSTVPWWRSGLETLGIGMSAAAMAFVVSYGLKNLLPVGRS